MGRPGHPGLLWDLLPANRLVIPAPHPEPSGLQQKPLGSRSKAQTIAVGVWWSGGQQMPTVLMSSELKSLKLGSASVSFESIRAVGWFEWRLVFG